MLEFPASLPEMLDLREIIERDICLLEFLLIQLRPLHNSDRIVIWWVVSCSMSFSVNSAA